MFAKAAVCMVCGAREGSGPDTVVRIESSDIGPLTNENSQLSKLPRYILDLDPTGLGIILECKKCDHPYAKG